MTAPQTSELWKSLISGKIEEAMNFFQAKLNDDPADRSNWVGLIAGFCALGQINQVVGIITKRHEAFHDGPLVVMEAMAGLASKHQIKILEFLANNWPKSRPDYVFCLYYHAHLLLDRDMASTAHPIFLECKKYFLTHGDALEVNANSELYSLYRHCVNLVESAQLQELLTTDKDHVDRYVGPVEWLDPADEHNPCVGFVAADRYYAETFGPDFLKALNLYWPAGNAFHLHIVDIPKSDQPALLAIMREHAGSVDLRISLSERPDGLLLEKSAYYASMRFFLICRLIERYQACIITFDIDMIAEKNLEPILAASLKANYSRYRRNNYGPGGHDYAALTAFSGPSGVDMAKLVERIIIERMEESPKDLWFVDQTALFQAWQLYSELDVADYQAANFSDSSPELEYFFDHLSAKEIKLRLSRLK